jgi:hypothetical protein
MRDNFSLFIVVGKAVLITTLGGFAPILGLFGPKFVRRGVRGMVAVSMVLFLWIAARWMFGTLRAHSTIRESRAVTTTFAAFAPVSFGMAMLFGDLSGGYAALLGSFWGLIGAFAGVVAIAALISFVLCLLTLRITRNIVRLESTP